MNIWYARACPLSTQQTGDQINFGAIDKTSSIFSLVFEESSVSEELLLLPANAAVRSSILRCSALMFDPFFPNS